MSEHSVVMAVAGYRSAAAAARDFGGVAGVRSDSTVEVAASLVHKGDGGRLVVDRHHDAVAQVPWRRLLPGAALVAIAAPLGIMFLTPIVARRIEWAGVAALVAHFWHDVPKGELDRMSDLVEASQAAIVVVAVDRAWDGLEPFVARADSTVVTTPTSADFERDYAHAVGALGGSG